MNRRLVWLVVLLVAFAAGTFVVEPPRVRGQSSGSAPGGTCSGCTIRVASGQTALHTALIASTACDDTTATATGALTTDSMSAIFAADPTAATGYAPLTTGGLQINFFLTANTFHAKVCNATSSSITPSAVSINWQVQR